MNTKLRDQLLHLLDDGAIGRLSVDSTGLAVNLYLMNGQVLAARSERDDQHLLRRLVASGYLSPDQVRHLRKLANGAPIGETLWDVLDIRMCEQLAFDRLRENIAAYLVGDGDATFVPMDALFVGHLHLLHDTRAIVGDLEVLIARASALRTETGMATLVSPGPKPKKRAHHKIWKLLGPETTVGQVVQASPLEELSTLDALVELMDGGHLIAQAVATVEEFDEEELLRELESTDATSVLPQVEEVTVQETSLEDTVETSVDEPGDEALALEGFSTGPDNDVYDQELAMFADHDELRGGGKDGHFSKSVTELTAERVDLTLPEQEQSDAPGTGVKMNFGGPQLSNEDAMKKIEVANQVLVGLVAAFDNQEGAGAGVAQIQLLLHGAPSEFASLFVAVSAGDDGNAPAAGLMKNLRKRPATEHRRFLNRALADLIDRAMNLGAENLQDDHVDAFLEGCVGYQSRLGL
ncbi:MAG TPA: hypothetical protein QGF58_21070 [Myxococcota bacterium]|nr:hypothetical protein [Myxococcota bacterium]